MSMTTEQLACGVSGVELPDQSAATNAAHFLGKRGGRPKGSCSSPLAMWLRSEIAQRQNEGYRCREAFVILRDTEMPDGFDTLHQRSTRHRAECSRHLAVLPENMAYF
jgi:hypothetical protein